MRFEPIEGVRVIGFSGKARNGKDTAVQAIVEAFPDEVQRFAFADPLKAVCRVIHGMREKDGVLLQRVGHGTRQKDPFVWERTLYYTVQEQRPKFALISDVRYPTEAQMVKDMGGVMIRVRRVLDDGRTFITPDRDPRHPSEIGLDDYDGFDFVIENYQGYPGIFREQARQVFEEIRNGHKAD